MKTVSPQLPEFKGDLLPRDNGTRTPSPSCRDQQIHLMVHPRRNAGAFVNSYAFGGQIIFPRALQIPTGDHQFEEGSPRATLV